MQGLQVARATSSNHLAVLERTHLWDGVCEITVPLRARIDSYVKEENVVPFAHFARGVGGGLINFYVFDDSPSALIGSTFTAHVDLYVHRYEGGKSFLRLECRPLQARVTHRIEITDRLDRKVEAGAERFDTPAPLKARIIFSREVESTGDAQLDRYLRDGWRIDRQDDQAVYLKKENGRALTHHKPKKDKKGRH